MLLGCFDAERTDLAITRACLYDPPSSSLGNHLLRGVLVTEEGPARVHRPECRLSHSSTFAAVQELSLSIFHQESTGATHYQRAI